MPPKKKGKGKGKKKAADEGPKEGFEPQVVLSNYQKMCKAISITPNQKVVDTICPPVDGNADPVELTQLILDNSDGPLGPGGTRALTCALLGDPQDGLLGGPFRVLKTLRIWRCNIGDDGAVAIADYLVKGGGDIAVSYVELMDNNIGARGCCALGEALDCGPDKKAPSKVVSLKLDYNSTIGCDGVEALCLGLRSNTVLKQLHLPYCNIGPRGALALAQAMSFPTSAIYILNLQGNKIGCDGLKRIADGLRRSKALQTLNLADNCIHGDVETLSHFAKALLVNQSLTTVDMLFNKLGFEGATALQPALTAENTRIKSFHVDASLPTALFETIYREAKKEKKGKKGKKKKK
jgi:hypothetical protein